MTAFYQFLEAISFNGLNILGAICLGGVLFLGGMVLYKSARKILRDMGDK